MLKFDKAILNRSSHPEVFCKKGVLRNFAKLTGKHRCQSLFFNIVAGSTEHLRRLLLNVQVCHSFRALKIEICQNLAQNLRRIEEISHMYVVVDLTFADVMSSNITVYSRKNTTLTVGKKWTFNMKLCNLYYIILTIWTHIKCAWTNTLSH